MREWELDSTAERELYLATADLLRTSRKRKAAARDAYR